MVDFDGKKRRARKKGGGGVGGGGLGGPSSEISDKELQQAMDGDIIPEMVEAMAGTIQRSQQHCQFRRDQFRDLIESIVEDVVMKKAVPAMVEAISALIPAAAREPLTTLGHNPNSRSLPLHAESSELRTLTLHFVLLLPGNGLYTMTKIQEHEDASLKVELRDSSGSRVEIGPESSAKIKLFVLRGDFDAEDRDDWTPQDFDNNVAKPRENKGPLLKGKCEIYMSNGVASFSDIVFTDNSKSRINGKFRFGARVVKGLAPGVVVRDAISEAFKVKERRVKFYSKNKTPCLEDWTDCLKHIGKTLCQKLAVMHQIYTVKDFLQLCNTDAAELQQILQIPGSKWSELVKFANSCSLTDQKGYCYHDKETSCVILLNCVFNIVAVKFNGQACQLYENLEDSQKKFVNEVRRTAYKKRNELPNIDIPCNLISLQAESLSVAGILHASTQHLGPITPDKMKMSSEHPAVGKKQGGHDGCSFTTNQTDQGEQEMLFNSPVDTAELETFWTSQAGPSSNQSRALCFQNQNFDRPANTSFFEGAEACIDDQFRMAPMNNSRLMVPTANASQTNICQSNVECNDCKRPRLL